MIFPSSIKFVEAAVKNPFSMNVKFGLAAATLFQRAAHNPSDDQYGTTKFGGITPAQFGPGNGLSRTAPVMSGADVNWVPR
jgi:hypothetical protein